MRLAYICADPGIPVFGDKGASVHVQEVLLALERRGISVDLFAARDGSAPPPSLATVRRHALPLPAHVDPAIREREAVAVNETLSAMLRAAGPFDVIYERHSLWSFAAMEYARSCGVPCLLEVNAPLIEEQATHRVLVDRQTAHECASRAMGAASAALAVSREVAEYVSRFAGREHVHVVGNGVDPERCSPEIPPSLPAPSGVRTLGFAGSLKPWHGVDLLIDAFDRIHRVMPRSRLLIVGDGPVRPSLEALIRRLRLSDAVVFTGAVPPREVPGLLTSMDVAAAPYPDQAGFYFSPLKVFEYMAAGRPIVASRIGQITEVIDHGVTGVLCSPGDAGALAAEVVGLFTKVARCRRLGTAARRRVCAAHTWDLVATRILDIAANAGRGAGAVAAP